MLDKEEGISKMPDISMCEGIGCPIKTTCYRFRALPTPYRQSYFSNPPIKEDKSCDYYMKYHERDSDGRIINDRNS